MNYKVFKIPEVIPFLFPQHLLTTRLAKSKNRLILNDKTRESVRVLQRYFPLTIRFQIANHFSLVENKFNKTHLQNKCQNISIMYWLIAPL